MQFDQLKRRQFITLLGSAATAWPVVARAQHPAKLPTIGFLGSTTALIESQRVAAFVQRLRQLGWIENRNVAIEYRWAEGRPERFAEIAAEFVQLKVDLIVAPTTPAVRRVGGARTADAPPASFRALAATRLASCSPASPSLSGSRLPNVSISLRAASAKTKPNPIPISSLNPACASERRIARGRRNTRPRGHSNSGTTH